jgi:hypothetical protein
MTTLGPASPSVDPLLLFDGREHWGADSSN